MSVIPPPDKFLRVIHRDNIDTLGLVACAGFELNEWRCRKLAEHLVNWLPHFALRPSEMRGIGPQNPFKLLKTAAARVFSTSNYEHRGEIGELLLHIISVTEYRAHAFVSRLYYKMRTNDQITGFDSALVCYDDDSDEIELWLGEAKFYTDTRQAVAAAINSLDNHLEQGFLEETKILVGPKIESDVPGYHKLQWLFDDRNTLDELIDKIVVPVLVASESHAAKNFPNTKDQYDNLVISEYRFIKDRFVNSTIFQRITIVVLYVPLFSKTALESTFAELLGAYE